ncbi:hypothetical protein [Pseudanabaena sp. PCC 6802]|uniref:hypothetical protein n=1 Tax=Pseudanabaena sp. PCC 6802 TaxID=118173 RepID=UPI000346F06D|nr:hypothetical protein [Pseudanabaena sp. PCC 6802]
MDAFELIPPDWTRSATHARSFCCPSCNLPPKQAKAVWINRRSPVYTDDRRRKWQEFYLCECDRVWWAWSSDRPPSEFSNRPSFEEIIPDDWV